MPATTNAIELLRTEHRQVQDLFRRFESAEESEEESLCQEIVSALKEHTRIEEEVFYPYVRQSTECEELMEEATIEHGTAKQLLAELEAGSQGVHRHAVVQVLKEYVGHHIREEEDKIFPLVKKTGVDLDALGQELLDHKEAAGRPESATAGRKHAKSAKSPKNGKSGETASGSARSANDERDLSREELMHDHPELSRSVRRAKWIEEPGETEDHPGQTLATRNPEVIKVWAEARGAAPATSPNGDPERPRVLRFDFPDYDKDLTPVEWEAWCQVFEDRGLVFVYQEHMKAGNQSNFFRLENPDRDVA